MSSNDHDDSTANAPDAPVHEDARAKPPGRAEHGDDPEETIEDPAGAPGKRTSWWQRLRRSMVPPTSGRKTTLELRTRILDEIEKGLRPFLSQRPIPVQRLTVEILARAGTEETTYAAALEDLAPPFEEAVRTRLHQAGFTLPPTFRIGHRIHTRPPKRLLEVFEQHGPIRVALHRHTDRARARLVVQEGKAEQSTYGLSNDADLAVGRLKTVVGKDGRIVRQNDVAFLDPETNEMSDAERACNE